MLVLALGCGKAEPSKAAIPKGPTYAEAMDLYSDERAELKYLEKEREKIGTDAEDVENSLLICYEGLRLLDGEERAETTARYEKTKQKFARAIAARYEASDIKIAKQEERVKQAKNLRDDAEATKKEP